MKNGGKVKDNTLYVRVQEPIPSKLEQSFPNMRGKYRVTIEDKESWKWKGEWKLIEHKQWGTTEKEMLAEKKGAEVVFTFNGTGAVIMGRWDKDGGKANVYVDGRFVREIDNYYYVMNRGAGHGWLNGAHLFHVINLEPGDHTIRIVVNGKKNDKSEGTKIRISRAIVYDRICD